MIFFMMGSMRNFSMTQLKRDIRALKREIAELDADSISVANDINDQMYRAYREERAAYDDFIASLDMADN